MDRAKLDSILTTLGEQVPAGSRIFLIGGSALTLLGSPRPSLDIDFVGDDVHPSELLRTIMDKAKEIKLQVDIVPLDRFIPLPEGNEQRSIRIGQFGNLEVNVVDSYSIAILEEFLQITKNAISKAGKFDLHPDILEHLQELKSRM